MGALLLCTSRRKSSLEMLSMITMLRLGYGRVTGWLSLRSMLFEFRLRCKSVINLDGQVFGSESTE